MPSSDTWVLHLHRRLQEARAAAEEEVITVIRDQEFKRGYERARFDLGLELAHLQSEVKLFLSGATPASCGGGKVFFSADVSRLERALEEKKK